MIRTAPADGRSRYAVIVSMLAAFLVLLMAVSAVAQPTFMRSEAERQLLNQNRVGLATGGPGGTYSRMGADLATLLNDPSHTTPFRVMVTLSQGSTNNLDDLFYLEKIDFAIVQSDVLAAFNADLKTPAELRRQLRLVAPLHNEEIHVLARGGIRSMAELEGKRVNIDARGSGTQITARNLFQRMGIRPEWVEMTTLQARDALLAGSIDALVYVVGKGNDIIKGIGGDKAVAIDLKFVPIDPANRDIDEYVRADLTSDDYPDLILQGQVVPTRAVTAVMAVYAWTPQTNPTRYQAARRFVDRFFERAPRLAQGGFSKSWCQVDLAGAVSNWERFDAANEWLANHRTPTRLCETAGSTCECPQAVSSQESCTARFQEDYRRQGLPILDVTLPVVRPLLSDWKRSHPDCQ